MEEPKEKKSYKYLFSTGRPTKFQANFIEEIVAYFDIEPYRKEVMETSTEYGKDGDVRSTSEKYKHIPNTFPTLLGFAMEKKLNYATLRRWAEKGEDPKLEEKLANKVTFSSKDLELAKNLRQFSEAYKTAKERQESFLIQLGLSGAAPSAAFIFTAKNTTKMRDKIEQEVTHRTVKPLLDNLILDIDNEKKAQAEERGS
jgi:hypothetical protein